MDGRGGSGVSRDLAGRPRPGRYPPDQADVASAPPLPRASCADGRPLLDLLEPHYTTKCQEAEHGKGEQGSKGIDRGHGVGHVQARQDDRQGCDLPTTPFIEKKADQPYSRGNQAHAREEESYQGNRTKAVGWNPQQSSPDEDWYEQENQQEDRL